MRCAPCRPGFGDVILAAMRKFNTEGPVVATDHYCIPPLERVNLDEILVLIDDKRYFVLHAPRQTGKTSVLLALRDRLNRGGGSRCVYVNVEGAQTAREDVGRAMRAILGSLASRARLLGDGFLDAVWPDVLAASGPEGALGEVLVRWSQADPRPLVLLIDEIDALIGDTLIAVLRQLRAGYDQRPGGFPRSVVLCGVRDVRDYRIRSRAENAAIAGGSAFNVRAESMRLGDFTETEVRALLAQHTRDTGQAFTPAALETVWRQTQGQPWLVNALCRRACFDVEAGRDRSRAIAGDDVLDAQEHLILSRQIHLDQLADKLREDRVRRVVEPLLAGASEDESSIRDIEYVRDLGLIALDDPPRIANPIYAEVVPRELTAAVQAKLIQDVAWYVDASGGLDVDKLLAAFQGFFREHSEHWLGRFDYAEAGAPAHPAGVPSARRERRRAHRARVRPRTGADRPAHPVAGRRGGGAGVGGRPVRDRVQGAAQGLGADGAPGPAADRRVHGALCGAQRPSRRLRPARREIVGREDLPARRIGRWPRHNRVGHVGAAGRSRRSRRLGEAWREPGRHPGRGLPRSATAVRRRNRDGSWGSGRAESWVSRGAGRSARRWRPLESGAGRHAQSAWDAPDIRDIQVDRTPALTENAPSRGDLRGRAARRVRIHRRPDSRIDAEPR